MYILKGACDMNVAIVGTARAKRGCPPKEIKRIKDDCFNTLYWQNDKDNYTIMRWVDNNIVTMVSSFHTPYNVVKSIRRKPRATTTNRNHLQNVWGDSSSVEIHIPGCIDDYNHWMNGVDKCDQFVAYYRNCLRCHRIWMPIMFHTLDIMRVNAYIVFKTLTEANNDPTIDHQSFVMAWIEKLLEHTTVQDYSRTQSAYEQVVAEVSPNPMKKRKG